MPPQERGHPQNGEGQPGAAPERGGGAPSVACCGCGGDGERRPGVGGTPRHPLWGHSRGSLLAPPACTPKSAIPAGRRCWCTPSTESPLPAFPESFRLIQKLRKGEFWEDGLKFGMWLLGKLKDPALCSWLDPDVLDEIPLAFHLLFPWTMRFVPMDSRETRMSLSLGSSHPQAWALQMLGQMLGQM